MEIDQKAVNSYNAIFADELEYKTQSVVNWNLKPDILIHGSPCQDISIAGHRKGMDKDSETRSSLMWETLNIIESMGLWRPKIVIWENVKGVLHKQMRVNFNSYLSKMESMGYKNSFEVLDAREFGLPQYRERCFVVSMLNSEAFDFNSLRRSTMRDIKEFLLDSDQVDEVYTVTQPSVLAAIGNKGIRRATVIQDFAYTITTRQDRTPAQVVDRGMDRFRYLTELECWRLQGYSDDDYFAAESTVKRNGRFRMPLYQQSGNSIPVTIFESLFEQLI